MQNAAHRPLIDTKPLATGAIPAKLNALAEALHMNGAPTALILVPIALPHVLVSHLGVGTRRPWDDSTVLARYKESGAAGLPASNPAWLYRDLLSIARSSRSPSHASQTSITQSTLPVVEYSYCSGSSRSYITCSILIIPSMGAATRWVYGPAI